MNSSNRLLKYLLVTLKMMSVGQAGVLKLRILQ